MRVKAETIEKLQAFIESLPDEAKAKCALCNETLVHIVKTAEARTGAPTRTVTKALAEEVNKNVPPGDRVSDKALQNRVRRVEGEKDALTNCKDSTSEIMDESDSKVKFPFRDLNLKNTDNKSPSDAEIIRELNRRNPYAIRQADIAIAYLNNIDVKDKYRAEAYLKVRAWIDARL